MNSLINQPSTPLHDFYTWQVWYRVFGKHLLMFFLISRIHLRVVVYVSKGSAPSNAPTLSTFYLFAGCGVENNRDSNFMLSGFIWEYIRESWINDLNWNFVFLQLFWTLEWMGCFSRYTNQHHCLHVIYLVVLHF